MHIAHNDTFVILDWLLSLLSLYMSLFSSLLFVNQDHYLFFIFNNYISRYHVNGVCPHGIKSTCFGKTSTSYKIDPNTKE